MNEVDADSRLDGRSDVVERGDIDASNIEQKIDAHAQKQKKIDVVEYSEEDGANMRQNIVVYFVVAITFILFIASLGVIFGWWDVAEERYETYLFGTTLGGMITNLGVLIKAVFK